MRGAFAERPADWLKAVLVAGLMLAAGSAGAQTQPAQPPSAKTPAAASTAAAAGPANDNKDNTNAARDRLKPNGPVTVTAASVDWAKDGMMVYTGGVKLDSDTLKIDGDRLELEQLGGGQYSAKVSGAPAHLLHQATVDSDGKPQPEVTARGKVVVYNSRTGVVDVNGDSRITRGEDEITGETIHYNVNERRIQAAGGTGGQVRIVIQPKDNDDSVDDKPVDKSSGKLDGNKGLIPAPAAPDQKLSAPSP